jgi:8-oxo-dGTP pyrophosphatase MutT (NUDIX family)
MTDLLDSTEERNPWTIQASEPVYSNPWIALTEHRVLNPKGKPGIYGEVHFRNLAIGIIPVDDDGHTWLVGQWRFPLQAYSWEIPEGGGPLDIDPMVSAQRELLEETGLVAERWQLLQELHLSNSVSDERALIYLATGLTQHAPEPEDTEQLRLVRLPLQSAIDRMLAGQITDAMSVAGLQRVYIELLAGRLHT